ncbi:MAG: SDR family oxidoreductase [Burkholderiales bacterium]|nr:SDR family oxidoreductase [Bacteroidia bacterium]
MISLINKRILITGASSGIGRATAVLFSKLGATVIITARNTENLNNTFSELDSNSGHLQICADLTSEEDIKHLTANVGIIDGIVHCCGKVLPVPVKFIKEEHLQDVFKVNYFSAVTMISELLKQKKINNNGSIVFISSVSTLHAYFGGGPYISSKAALEGYAKTLAFELIPKKIRVNVLQPALVNTEIFDSTVNAAIDDDKMKELINSYPLGIGETIDVANALAFFISDASKWITGSTLKMDGGLTLGFK